MFKKMLVSAALGAPFLILSIAQEPAVKRTPLQTVDFLPAFTTVTVAAEVAGACVAADANPGTEAAYVLESAILLEVRVKSPDAFKTASLRTPLLALGVVCCESEACDGLEFLWGAPASAGSA
jgi:hypothetical protein